MPRKPDKAPKTAVVAFKVEKELAELLNKLPNKSAFIRSAIAAQLGVSCPLCHGKGVVARGVHDHFTPLVSQFSHRNCDSCGHDMALPLDAARTGPGRSTRPSWATRTAAGSNSSSSAARSTATAATTRPRAVATAAGTSPPAPPPNTARPTARDQPPRSPAHRLRRPAAPP